MVSGKRYENISMKLKKKNVKNSFPRLSISKIKIIIKKKHLLKYYFLFLKKYKCFILHSAQVIKSCT